MGAMTHQLGKCVDGFDEVVRFNTAVVSAEFAPYIGTKTTIWAHSDWTAIVDPSGHEKAATQYADCQKLMAVPDIPMKQDTTAPEGTEMIPLTFERETRLEVSTMPGRWLTTGIITLAWLLQRYHVIHVLGWFSNNENFHSHYFQAPNTSPCVTHDPDAERRWLKKQVQSGRIVEITTENSVSYKETKFMRAKHPFWSGIMHFHKNMRMERPGIDSGGYCLKAREFLELKWDRWPAEILHWAPDENRWENDKGDFVLEEIL
jgi:hypothetical protein